MWSYFRDFNGIGMEVQKNDQAALDSPRTETKPGDCTTVRQELSSLDHNDLY